MTLIQAYLWISDRIPATDPKMRQRLDRAYGIVQCNGEGYSIEKLCNKTVLGKPMYSIHKASTSLLEDTSATYLVTEQSCSCPDYEKARGNLCKHRLAVMLITAMEKGNEHSL